MADGIKISDLSGLGKLGFSPDELLELSRKHREHRGGELTSFENGVRALDHKMAAGATNYSRGILGIASSYVLEILKKDRDLFWIERLPAGGIAAHTPSGRMLIGASHGTDADLMKGSILTIFSNDGIGVSLTKAPILKSMGNTALIGGKSVDFHDRISTPDSRYEIVRKGDHAVEIFSEGRGLGRASLVEEFKGKVEGLDDLDTLMESLKYYMESVYWSAETAIKRLRSIEDRRNYGREKSVVDESSLARTSGFFIPDLDAIVDAAAPLEEILTAREGFLKNSKLGDVWEGAFMEGLFKQFDYSLGWFAQLPLHADQDVSGNFEIGEAISAARGIFAPHTIIDRYASNPSVSKYIEIEVGPEETMRIESENPRALRQIIDKLVSLIGKTGEGERTKISVEWNEERRILGFTDASGWGHSFEFIGRSEQGDLERLARKMGGGIRFLFSTVAVHIPVPAGPKTGGGGGGIRRLPDLGRLFPGESKGRYGEATSPFAGVLRADATSAAGEEWSASDDSSVDEKAASVASEIGAASSFFASATAMMGAPPQMVK